jgi:hypothetical protein
VESKAEIWRGRDNGAGHIGSGYRQENERVKKCRIALDMGVVAFNVGV